MINFQFLARACVFALPWIAVHPAKAAALADGLDAVPSVLLKNIALIVLAVLGGLASWAIWQGYVRKKDRSEIFERKPVTPVARTPNVRRDVFDLEMGRVNSKLIEHGTEIGRLWDTMRAEDKEIRETLARAIRDFEGATERIEGTLGEVRETTNKLLQRALDR
jgi:hypothetical protein